MSHEQDYFKKNDSQASPNRIYRRNTVAHEEKLGAAYRLRHS